MNSDFGLSMALRDSLQRVFERVPGIGRVWLYGSRARGDHRRESDIDLAVEAESADAFTKAWAAVERLESLYKIDMVDFMRLGDSNLRSNIENERALFWERSNQAEPASPLRGV